MLASCRGLYRLMLAVVARLGLDGRGGVGGCPWHLS